MIAHFPGKAMTRRPKAMTHINLSSFNVINHDHSDTPCILRSCRKSAFALALTSILYVDVVYGITYDHDETINGNPPSYEIELSPGVDLSINEGTLYDPVIKGGENSSITIKIENDHDKGTGIYLLNDDSYSLIVGKLNIFNKNKENGNNGKGIYSYGHAKFHLETKSTVIQSWDDSFYVSHSMESGVTTGITTLISHDFLALESTAGSGIKNNGLSTVNAFGGVVSNPANVTDEELQNMTGTLVFNTDCQGDDGQAGIANRSFSDVNIAGKTVWINQRFDPTTHTVLEEHSAGDQGLLNKRRDESFDSGDLSVQALEDIHVYGTKKAVSSLAPGGTILIRTLSGNNYLISSSLGTAVYAESGKVDVVAENGSNEISANDEGMALHTEGNGQIHVTGVNNSFSGLVHASATPSGQNTGSILIKSTEKATFDSQAASFSDGRTNSVSALYTSDGDAIQVTAKVIEIHAHAQEGEDHKERAVWAEHGTISLSNTELHIKADKGTLLKPNQVGAAIIAGASIRNDLTEDNTGYVDATGLQKGTRIFGDLVAGKLGKIDFELSQGNGSIVQTDSGNVDLLESDEDITGNVLAANGGVVNLTIGQSVIWSGRADNYQDSINNKWDHLGVFAPEFSNEITSSGEINLILNEGAYWNVTGQSWVTRLAGNGGTINLINSDTADGTASHALHVQKIEGHHTFVLNLNDTNHSLSDMLYIQERNGEDAKTQTIRINSLEGLENMAHNDRIRFATVNTSENGLHFETEVSNGGDGKTRTLMRDVGFYDVGFRIEHETRSTDKKEDGEYNGEDLDLSKPGNDWVDDHYAAEDAQNWYLVRDQSLDETSNAGETILATARSAYWNAIEIDRLNKRLGDARHAEGGTEGFWIRVRNDRIGTDRSTGNFRSRNYAYQFGYDHSKREDDGKRLFGAALDYMDGNTTYRDVEGTGATDRFGLTAYMTWLGDNGWYYDLVGKWGVLSNSFRLATDTGSRVSADYDNHVLGVSFEFGRKFTKDDSLWFVEPQAQIQHVMVTEASYNTNQGTAVEQDKINSTITRLGLRFGRNFGEKANGIVYAKADWLKEWHGHQGITVTDKTTGMTAADVSIENKGDWFDAGFGIQSPISKTTYFFADAEYVFGNHLDNTWNFNAGVRWMFH